MDEGFDFLFSLHSNDLIDVAQKGKPVLRAYFATCHRGTGNINLWAHDRNASIGKAGAIEGLGVKTATAFAKLNTDVLGNTYPAPPETRRDLA